MTEELTPPPKVYIMKRLQIAGESGEVCLKG
jgi:hypothetical protein